MRACRRFMRRRPPSADGGEAVGEHVLGVGVKGADERDAGGEQSASQPISGTTGSWM